MGTTVEWRGWITFHYSDMSLVIQFYEIMKLAVLFIDWVIITL